MPVLRLGHSAWRVQTNVGVEGEERVRGMRSRYGWGEGEWRDSIMEMALEWKEA